MKKWLPLVLLPIGASAVLCARTQAWSQDAPVDFLPRVQSQAELDSYALANPHADFDDLGHAYGNSEARLFWNTDWNAAKQQAAREGKPILVLRLLGNLSDEYSCANSRFFRVLFYPQSQINARLRRDFVLFWSSERPVPVMTVDMGDGRILKRTITGNSAHYLLDASGRPLDVFPGLSTPQTFERWLASSQKLAQEFKAQPQNTRGTWLANWHEQQLRKVLKGQLPKVTPAGLDSRVKSEVQSNPLTNDLVVVPVPAGEAASLAVSKMVAEGPTLGAFERQLQFTPTPSFSFIAQPPLLDGATRARIRAMNPVEAEPKKNSGVGNAQQVSLGQDVLKLPEKTRFNLLVSAFENSLRADDERNAQMSIPIHALFMQKKEGDFQALNRRIYDRLFKTPKSDPWLGLTSDTTFAALQNNGIITPDKTPPNAQQD